MTVADQIVQALQNSSEPLSPARIAAVTGANPNSVRRTVRELENSLKIRAILPEVGVSGVTYAVASTGQV